MWNALTVLFGFACRVWDFIFSPRQVSRRRQEEVDRAIADHDQAKVNEILDDNLHP